MNGRAREGSFVKLNSLLTRRRQCRTSSATQTLSSGGSHHLIRLALGAAPRPSPFWALPSAALEGPGLTTGRPVSNGASKGRQSTAAVMIRLILSSPRMRRFSSEPCGSTKIPRPHGLLPHGGHRYEVVARHRAGRGKEGDECPAEVYNSEGEPAKRSGARRAYARQARRCLAEPTEAAHHHQDTRRDQPTPPAVAGFDCGQCQHSEWKADESCNS